MKDINELYAYRIIKTGEEDTTDYTAKNFYNYWLHDFRDGIYRMCEQNLGRHGNTPIQDIAYKEIKKHKWSNDEIDFLFQICCEFGFEFKQDWNDDNDYWILYGDFDKHLQNLCIEPWQICYAYLKCSEYNLISYEKHIKEICTDLLDYIYNELN